MLRRTLLGLALYLLSGAMIARAGQFLEAPQYPTGTNPQAVALGDFNRNGKPDLAVANSTSNTVSVLLGNGDSTFQTQVDYATGTNPQGIAVGDFNGDGILDLAVTNSASNTVSVFLGNGDGTFRAKADYATGRQPQGRQHCRRSIEPRQRHIQRTGRLPHGSQSLLGCGRRLQQGRQSGPGGGR